MTTGPAHATHVIAVSGLKAEARIAAAVGVTPLSAGGDAVRLALSLEASLAAGAQAVISFGIAGGLAPGLRAGSVVVAETVDDGETAWRTDAAWRARLLAALPQARSGKIFGTDRPVAGAEAKGQLHWRSGSQLVDMESHVAARLAKQHGVPFAALRVVADPAERSLPRAALVGMRPDGRTDVGAVVRALAAKPSELPALLRIALDARAAFAALARARTQLDPQFGVSPAATGGAVSGSAPGRAAGLALAKADNR